ncbi:Long-chain acyl-[acyl-carrier-protein] reductase [Candidatus Entotheonellaceae bacterium PAL068K]
MPHLSNSPPWFSFIVHPRDFVDLERCGPARFIRTYSTSEADFVDKLREVPPVVIGNVTFGFSAIRGEVIAVLRMPDAMGETEARRAIIDGSQIACKRGATIIGLGALTSSATGGGLLLSKELPAGTTITNGNAYTAAVVRRNVIEAQQFLGGDPTVAIVGATGSVGAALSRWLDQDGFRLMLIGRKVEKVHRLFPDLAGTHIMTDDVHRVGQAEIVVLLTSEPSARILPSMPMPGSVVIDCAQPANILKTDYPLFRFHDISVAEGGIVRLPGYRCDYNFGLEERDSTFACLTETYLFAREGIREPSVGRTKVDLARFLEQAAEKYGIVPRSLKLSHPVDDTALAHTATAAV